MKLRSATFICLFFFLVFIFVKLTNNVQSPKVQRKIYKSCGDFCELIKPLALANRSTKIKDFTGHYLYLTFDDAPNDGTEHVLDALKEVGVKATFFVIGFKLVKPQDPSKLRAYQKVIIRMIEEGHLLGDHSYDHMLHNIQNTPHSWFSWFSNNYAGVSDIVWFGEKNIDAVTAVMRTEGFNEEKVVNVINTMWNYVRLPFTNNWRVGNITASKGEPNSVKLSDALRDVGSHVFGWDQEWDIDWSISRFYYGGERMFRRLNWWNWWTKATRKTVMISHDNAHRPGGNLDAKAELVKFLSLAKHNGYKFRTVDTYLTD